MNAPSDAVLEHLCKAKQFHDFVVQKYPDGKFTGDLRHHVFMALFGIMLEHHGAMIVLIESGQHYGSALTLLRPLFETSLRATWTLYCVNEEKLNDITQKKADFPAFADCKKAVATRFAGQQHWVSLLTPEHIKQLHGLTHTGMEAIQFRICEDLEHKPIYPDETIRKALVQATCFLMRVFRELLSLVEKTDDADEIAQKFIELFSHSPENKH